MTNFVHVQVESLHQIGQVLAVPATLVPGLMQAEILEYGQQWTPPYVCNPDYDDMLIATPGTFLISRSGVES